MNILRVCSAFTSRLGALALLFLAFTSGTVLYFAFAWHTSAKPALGIVYFYDRDETYMIISELERIKEDGFQIVSIPFVWHDNPKDPLRVKTDVLMEKCSQLGLKVYVREPWQENFEALEKYLSAYASKISYFQVINEADSQFFKEWRVPGELASLAQKNAEIIKKFNPNIKTVASFSTPLTPTLIARIAEHVDIVALDIYEQVQLDTFPIQMQTLLTLSGKDTIWIGEFGYASLDDQAQAEFIRKGLDIFAKNGVEAVIIWGWKSFVGLNIKDRLAETTIKTWSQP
ncbi:hypothetical protein DRO69_01410 [Candidatus Bathyarchaeota archaeon]|nr:MAG: hypothetical protein DRO69_01410 [Candidatus Bathyarchaeota archaeon]